MKEIEAKILNIDRKQIENKLLSLGAKKVFDGEVHALFFDFDNNGLKKKKRIIRLRKEGNKAVLTTKEGISKEGAKISEEHEVEVSDFETAKKMLETLGLSAWLDMTKRRTTYSLDGVHFEIDNYTGEYDHIPEFLEIEAKDKKTIYKYAKILGFSQDDCKPWTAKDLMKYFPKNEGKHFE